MRISLSVAVVPLLGAAVLAPPVEERAARQPSCPMIFGHGGYPKKPGATKKDLIRQTNNPRAVDDQRAWGANGIEADVQLTRDGTKAVMWHNVTTNGLSGTKRKITDLWWSAGDENLSSRRISRGPYTGERVYTLREWLDHVRSTGMIALLEIKTSAKTSLGDPARALMAWKELSTPIYERQYAQRIMVYSKDAWIQSQLARRHPRLLRGSAIRWTDGAAWDEPPPPWHRNITHWQEVLDREPAGIMTNYTHAYRRWLSGKCGDPDWEDM